MRVGETKRFLESKPALHVPEVVRMVALGETWSVTYRKDRRHSGISLRADQEKLVVSGSDLNRDAVIRKLKDWLRLKVREGLFPLAERLPVKHRLKLGGLLVKSQRTRWASCSPATSIAESLLPRLEMRSVNHEPATDSDQSRPDSSQTRLG
jgi:hypothetical protein